MRLLNNGRFLRRQLRTVSLSALSIYIRAEEYIIIIHGIFHCMLIGDAGEAFAMIRVNVAREVRHSVVGLFGAHQRLTTIAMQRQLQLSCIIGRLEMSFTIFWRPRTPDNRMGESSCGVI